MIVGDPPLSRSAARLALAAYLLFTLLAVAITLSPLRSGYADAPDRGPGDLALYRAEVDRIRAGENYYQAANVELRQRGYPTRSVFNWRTPLPMWLVAKLPHPQAGRLLMGLLALAALFYGFTILEGESHVWQGVGCGMLMFGALLPSLMDHLYVAPELWAGSLVVLSLAAYSRGRVTLAILLGIAAVMFRDIAAPYCLLMGLLAFAQRRWSEVWKWALAFALYAVFFACHVYAVKNLITAGDRAHQGTWVQLGGLPFVLSVSQMNLYLLLLPQWVTAIYLGMALLGLARWHSPIGQRIGLTVCAYLTLFSVVGYPFNQYWGSLVAPLLCFGVAHFPTEVAQLWRAALQSSASATFPSPVCEPTRR
jgi:hypothetical protein